MVHFARSSTAKGPAQPHGSRIPVSSLDRRCAGRRGRVAAQMPTRRSGPPGWADSGMAYARRHLWCAAMARINLRLRRHYSRGNATYQPYVHPRADERVVWRRLRPSRRRLTFLVPAEDRLASPLRIERPGALETGVVLLAFTHGDVGDQRRPWTYPHAPRPGTGKPTPVEAGVSSIVCRQSEERAGNHATKRRRVARLPAAY